MAPELWNGAPPSTASDVYAPLVGGAGEEVAEQRAADALTASFERATVDPDQFSSRFYEHAFTIDPTLRPLFPSDLSGLRMKLVSTLQTVVRNTRAPERLVPMLEDLGERHHGYGVRPATRSPRSRARGGTSRRSSCGRARTSTSRIT